MKLRLPGTLFITPLNMVIHEFIQIPRADISSAAVTCYIYEYNEVTLIITPCPRLWAAHSYPIYKPLDVC